MDMPHLPIGDAFEAVFLFAVHNLQPLFTFVSAIIEFINLSVARALIDLPWPIVAAVFVIAMWRFAGRAAAVFTLVGLIVLVGVGLWVQAMMTLALMSSAIVLTLAIGVPLGIFAAHSNTFNATVTPVLDFLQTMPAFIFLIPAVMMFGVGPVPAVIATLCYALPVPIRLTNVGIRQVDPEVVEAAEAFGLSQLQLLFKVKLPMAFPVILAGVNQTIMYALGMVIIASMIGAGGLGAEVLRGMSRIELGSGFEAGLAVVIVAMILDRLGRGLATSALNKDKRQIGNSWWRRRSTESA